MPPFRLYCEYFLAASAGVLTVGRDVVAGVVDLLNISPSIHDIFIVSKKGYPVSVFCCLQIRIEAMSLPVEVGACVEPLSIAYHAVKRSNFKPGQTVLIAGAGPVSTR